MGIGIVVGMGALSVGGVILEKVMEKTGKGDPTVVNTVVSTTLLATTGIVIINCIIKVVKAL